MFSNSRMRLLAKLAAAAVVALLVTGPAAAQTVQQSGTVTQNQLPVWITRGVIGPGGTAADSPISSIGATGSICSNSARQASGAWIAMCIGYVAGLPTFSVQNFGSQAAQPLQFIINGVTYAFPGSLANITIGTTPVVGGTNGQCLFVSSGVVGQQNCTLAAITSLSGDITATGPGPAVATLATVNGTPGTFGSASLVPIITVNGKGLITNVSTTPFGFTVGSSPITGGITNGLLYDNGGVIGNLSTLGNGVLVTSSGGVPSIATTLPSALSIPSPTFTGTVTMPDAATWTTTGITKAVAISTGSASLPASGNINVSGQYQVNGSQIAASNLSNGTQGSGAVVLATSPTIAGTWAGNVTFSGALTFSGNDTFTAQGIFQGTSAPSSAAGNTVIMGTLAAPTLTNTGQAFLYNTLVNGAIIQGDGSTNDVSVFNKGGSLVFGVPTGSTKLNFPSLASGTCSSGLGLDSGNNTILISCPGAASSIQVGTTSVTSATGNNYILTTGTGSLANVQPQGGLVINSSVLTPPGGYVNLLRGSSMTAFFHGTSGTATTTAASTNWTAEGVFAIPTGASVTWSQQTLANCPTGNPTFNCVKLTGAASVTGVKVRFVVESYTAAQMAGKTVTFQLLWKNNSGSSITPTLATAFPTTQDGSVTAAAAWGGTTTDLSSTSMQACTNGSTCTESYTLAVSSSATAGYEFVVDFGNNFGNASNTLTIGGGFEARVTPGVATGTNANPPPPEIRSADSDMLWSQRFYMSTFPNGTAPAQNVGFAGSLGATCINTAGNLSYTWTYPVPMRAKGTVVTYNPAATNANWWEPTSGQSRAVSVDPNGAQSINSLFLTQPGATCTGADNNYIQATVDATIWGG